MNLRNAAILCLIIVLAGSIRSVAQNCVPGTELVAPAGGSVAVTSNLSLYNSTEAGQDGAAARAAVDLQDDAWRLAVTTAYPAAIFDTWVDTTTAQGNFPVPVSNAFVITGISVDFDYRDLPSNYRTVTAPCIGATIASASERVAFFAKTNPMQGSENAPRPASLYNTGNQPIIYDEIQYSSQPGRNSSINAIVFSFSSNPRTFGFWIGDTETRTDGSGVPMIVRFLDASGNRIGNDVQVEPIAGSQAGCGAASSTVGCGNRTTRWLGFLDTSPSPQIKQMVVIAGYQGGPTSNAESQRVAFIGPTMAVVPTAGPAEISGRVSTASGRGIPRARLLLKDAKGTSVAIASTNGFGYYRFPAVAAGMSYLVTVMAKGRTFDPDTVLVTPEDNIQNLDFVSNQ